MRVFTLDKMRRNAEKCDRICGNRLSISKRLPYKVQTRLSMTARGEVEDGEGRREAFRGPGMGGVSPARSRRRAARGLLRPVTNSIEALIEGDMADKYFSHPHAPLKIPSSHSPKIFPDLKHSYSESARPPPPTQLLDERRGWTL